MQAENLDLVIDGAPVRIRADDSSEIRPRIGINPIALDKNGECLYYGPMHGHSMYRNRSAGLRNDEQTPRDLAAGVERWSDKPFCDGISIDDAATCVLVILPTMLSPTTLKLPVDEAIYT